jgi:hypothetical protein
MVIKENVQACCKPDSRTVKMDTGMNSPMRNAIIHEVETAVSNTKQDLLNSMAVLIDSRLARYTLNRGKI